MTAQQQRGRRRWYQFTLRSVLLFFLVIVLGLVAWRAYVEPYRYERQAMKLIEDLGGRYSTETRGPAWLTKLFGADYFQVVTFADLADCDEPERYLPATRHSPWLEVLVIGGDAVGDEEMTALRRLAGLQGVVLDSTRVTDGGVQELQEALPDLAIHKSQRRAIGVIKQFCHDPFSFVGTHAVLRPVVFAAEVGDDYFEVAVNVCLRDQDRLKLTDGEMAALRALVDLETFVVNGDESLPAAPMTDAGLANLALARNLRLLLVGGAGKVTDLNWLQGSKIEHLGLDGTALTDRELQRLPLPQLRELDISRTKITDAGLQALRECTELRALNLKDTRVTNAGLSRLTGLSEIRALRLGGTKIDVAGLRQLTSFPNLEFLDLSDLPGKSSLDDSALPELEKLRGLKVLCLDGAKITAEGLSRFQQHFPALETLYIRETRVRFKAVEALRAARPKLQVDYTQAKDEAAQWAIETCRNRFC